MDNLDESLNSDPNDQDNDNNNDLESHSSTNSQFNMIHDIFKEWKHGTQDYKSDLEKLKGYMMCFSTYVRCNMRNTKQRLKIKSEQISRKREHKYMIKQEEIENEECNDKYEKASVLKEESDTGKNLSTNFEDSYGITNDKGSLSNNTKEKTGKSNGVAKKDKTIEKKDKTIENKIKSENPIENKKP